MMKIISIGFALACSAVPAVAEEASRSERVSYADLDLQSAAGKAVLENRIRGAAERVCSEEGVRETHRLLTDDDCVMTALADGLSKVNRQIANRAGRPLPQTR